VAGGVRKGGEKVEQVAIIFLRCLGVLGRGDGEYEKTFNCRQRALRVAIRQCLGCKGGI